MYILCTRKFYLHTKSEICMNKRKNFSERRVGSDQILKSVSTFPESKMKGSVSR